MKMQRQLNVMRALLPTNGTTTAFVRFASNDRLRINTVVITLAITMSFFLKGKLLPNKNVITVMEYFARWRAVPDVR
jgi:hypothetical protein